MSDTDDTDFLLSLQPERFVFTISDPVKPSNDSRQPQKDETDMAEKSAKLYSESGTRPSHQGSVNLESELLLYRSLNRKSPNGSDLKNDSWSIERVNELLREVESTRNQISERLKKNEIEITLMTSSEKKSSFSGENAKEVNESDSGQDTPILITPPRKSDFNFRSWLPTENKVNEYQMKLEAEELKRKRCEDQIAQLEANVLQLQKRLTITKKVDDEKDRAIQELKVGWNQMIEHWKVLESQRHQISTLLEHERQAARNFALNMESKIEDLKIKLKETEDRALDFEANVNKLDEMNKSLMSEKVVLEEKLEHQSQSIDMLENDKERLITQNESFQNIIRSAEDNLKKVQLEIKKRDEKIETLMEDHKQTARCLSDGTLVTRNYIDKMLEKQKSEFEKELEETKNILKQQYSEQLKQDTKILLDKEKNKLSKMAKNMMTLDTICKRLGEELSKQTDLRAKEAQQFKNELKQRDQKIAELENIIVADASWKNEVGKRFQYTMEKQWTELWKSFMSTFQVENQTMSTSAVKMPKENLEYVDNFKRFYQKAKAAQAIKDEFCSRDNFENDSQKKTLQKETALKIQKSSVKKSPWK